MYRGISELKGLIIDIDSFRDVNITDWEEINQKYKCLFIVVNEEQKKAFQEQYGEDKVYMLEPYYKLFAPSQITHKKAIDDMELNATEVAYVSRDKMFLDNAMSFLGGTVWVTDEVTYNNMGKAPDLSCRGFKTFKNYILQDVKGFLGEVVIYPSQETRGVIIPMMFETDEGSYPLYMLGRYFNHHHYMSQLHPYSSAVYLNKKEERKAFGKFNDIFSKLYSSAIKRIQLSNQIDGIVPVPVRPGRKERFKTILDFVCESCGIEDLSEDFKCVKDYPTQKNLDAVERQKNIAGVFQYDGNLQGKNIVLIDDIVTTGATIRECISVLKARGAEKIFIVVLAVNQMSHPYWSADVAQVTCGKCGEKMHLLINSYNREFFYSCYGCHSTKSFEQGRMELCELVNSEMRQML